MIQSNVCFRVMAPEVVRREFVRKNKENGAQKRMEPDQLGSVSPCEGMMGNMDSELLGK